MPTYWPAVRYGGPIYSVHELCKALTRQGHEVHVFTTNVDGRSDSEVKLGRPVSVEGVKVWYFRSRIGRRLYFSPPMMGALRRHLNDFDVVHLHSVFLWPTWAGARMASRFRIPYVLSPRGMLFKGLVRRKRRWVKTLWIYLIERANIRRAARIHVTAGLEETALREFAIPVPPVARIANGVNAMEAWRREDVSEEVSAATRAHPYVLYVGRLNWKKGLDRLVASWGGSMPARLIIAGNDEDGYVHKLQRIARDNECKDVCFMVRFVSEAEKGCLFERASLFVLPSYSENFGNTVVEAMASGLPVVTTPEVGAAQLVTASGGGVVVPGDQMRDSIIELLADESSRTEMGRKGRAFVEEHLTWDKVAGEMESMYREILADRRA